MGAGMKFGDIDNTKVPNLALNKILCHNITLVVLFQFQFVNSSYSGNPYAPNSKFKA